MNVTVYADKIYYYQQAVESPAEIVQLLEGSDVQTDRNDVISKWEEWTSSEIEDPYVFGYKKDTDESKLETSLEETSLVYRTLKDSLTKAGKNYAEAMGIDYVEPNAISISKYSTGAFMGAHIDHYSGSDIEPLMSAVLYLNDDYEGGELEFPEQKVIIKPKAGSIVIFPSVHPFYHQSLTILSGIKYMSPAFWVKQPRHPSKLIST